MLQSFIEWWADKSRRSKYLLSFGILTLDLVLSLNGHVWVFGWAIGSVLLFCTFFRVAENWD